MHFSEQTDLSAIVNLTLSACILHNICTDFNKTLGESTEDGTKPAEEKIQFGPTTNQRNQVFNYMIRKNSLND